MANYTQSEIVAIGDMNQGFTVIKASASCGATADVSLFTVAGGKVALLGLVGECDGTMEAAATTILVKHQTGGTVTPLSIPCTTLTGKVVDTMLTLPAAVGGALTISTNEGAAVLLAPTYILQPGILEMTVAGATNTQTITWTLWYVPMEVGAYVEAA